MSAPYELLAEVYDGGWFEYSEYVAGLVGEIEEERGAPFRRVCDAACGTGLLLMFLGDDESTERRLAGFDVSAAMLDRARERLPGAGLAPGDLREGIPFHGPFDLITCVYDSLNYLLDAEDVLRFFTAARGRLFSNGLFLVDFNTAEMYESRDGMEQPRLIGGLPFRESLRFDPGPPPLVTTTFEFPAGREVHSQRPWEEEEIVGFLTQAGFRVLDTFDVVDPDSGAQGDGGPVDSGGETSGKVVCTAIPQ